MKRQALLVLSFALLHCGVGVGGGVTYLTVGKVQARIGAGKTEEVVIPVTVAAGFHVQANPASNPQLIPTQLDFTESKWVKAGSPVYPTGKPYRLQGAAVELATYEGKIEIRVPVTVLKGAKGKQLLSGKLRYQACNDKICFFPATTPVTVRVTVK